MVDAHPSGLQPDLPPTAGAALLRGLRGRCPRCDGAPLFRAWLKPVDRCPCCAQDWSVQQADDFPAYIGIIVTGHLLAPIVIAMIGGYGISAWLTLAIILPLAVVLLLVTLQPVKGGVIAFLWWNGIGAFTQERRSVAPDRQDAE
tara:strand:- start:706 stop:1140 length:435 start_codon:yes stop_codon:yes gene_type:complete